jgi:hypothetical protein
MTKVNKIHQHHQLGITFHFLYIDQIRNCRVRNINKHHPTKIYSTQILDNLCWEYCFFLRHNRGRDVCAV